MSCDKEYYNIKPCPFCGSADILKIDLETIRNAQGKILTLWGAECQHCGACEDLSTWQSRPNTPFDDPYFKGLTHENIAELAKKSIRLIKNCEECYKTKNIWHERKERPVYKKQLLIRVFGENGFVYGIKRFFNEEQYQNFALESDFDSWAYIDEIGKIK